MSLSLKLGGLVGHRLTEEEVVEFSNEFSRLYNKNRELELTLSRLEQQTQQMAEKLGYTGGAKLYRIGNSVLIITDGEFITIEQREGEVIVSHDVQPEKQ